MRLPVPGLIEALAHNRAFKVRMQAAVYLGRAHDEKAVAPLMAALAAENHNLVRSAIIEALAELSATQSIPLLVRLQVQDPDDFVRKEAQRALDHFDKNEALPHFIAAYTDAEDAEVRRAALTYVAELADPKVGPVLIAALGDSPAVFQVARRAIVAMRPEAARALLATALDHRDAQIRRGAIEVLRAMHDEQAGVLLLHVYSRDLEADEVRSAVAGALRELAEFVPLEPVIAQASAPNDKFGRGQALRLLGVLGGPKAQATLVSSLDDADLYVRGNAVIALGLIGNEASVAPLEKMLTDPANARIDHLIRQTLKQIRQPTSTP